MFEIWAYDPIRNAIHSVHIEVLDANALAGAYPNLIYFFAELV